jgi:hypothetical protein
LAVTTVVSVAQAWARDQQVIAADGSACRRQFGSHTAILSIGRNIDGKTAIR